MKLAHVFLVVFLLASSTILVQAQTLQNNDFWTLDNGDVLTLENPAPSNQLKSPLSYDSVEKFLDAFLTFVITISVPILAFMIIYVGFVFVKARGNSERLSEARRMFYYLVIGALLVLGASVLARAIKGTVEDIKRGSAIESTHYV